MTDKSKKGVLGQDFMNNSCIHESEYDENMNIENWEHLTQLTPLFRNDLQHNKNILNNIDIK